MTTLSSFLGFNWNRFSNPLVISGLAVMVVGMALLIASSSIAKAITASLETKGKPNKDTSLFFKLLSGALVVIGALLAVFGA